MTTELNKRQKKRVNKPELGKASESKHQQQDPTLKNGTAINNLKKNALFSINIAGSEIRFRIVIILSLFPELSLKDIYTKLNSPKTTIYRNLNKLIKKNLVECFPKKKMGQDRYVNHYRLKGKGYGELRRIILEDLSNLSEEEQLKILTLYSNTIKVQTDFVTYAMNLYHKWFVKFTETYEPNNKGKIIFGGPHKINRHFEFFDELLTDSQYDAYKEAYKEFCQKIDQIIEQNHSVVEHESVKPYYIFHGTIPLKDFMGYDEMD